MKKIKIKDAYGRTVGMGVAGESAEEMVEAVAELNKAGLMIDLADADDLEAFEEEGCCCEGGCCRC
jgi:hypothetical protein